MSLIFVEGWDDIPGQSMSLKGWSGTNVTVAGNGQFATYGSLTFGNNTAMFKDFPNTDPTIIVGFYLKNVGGFPNAYDRFIELWGDNGTTRHLTLACGPDGQFHVYLDTVGGTLLGSTGTPYWPVSGSACYVEWKVLISDTVGTVDLQINGVNVLSLTNQDTKNGGTNSYINRLMLVGVSGDNVAFDDIYVANTQGSINNDFLGPCHVETQFPDVEGSTIQYTPSTGTDNSATIDENPASSADYNSNGTPGNFDLLGFPDLPGTPSSVFGVQLTTFAAKSDTGTIQYRHRVLNNGQTATGPDIAPNTTYDHKTTMFEADPDGGGAWTVADVNAAEFGYETRT